MIGVVMQDDQLFAGSVADNISFFGARPDARLIEECARLASLHDELAAMPMGYSTLIGDMGTVLSGGQKQRVLIARALYRQPASCCSTKRPATWTSETKRPSRMPYEPPR